LEDSEPGTVGTSLPGVLGVFDRPVSAPSIHVPSRSGENVADNATESVTEKEPPCPEQSAQSTESADDADAVCETDAASEISPEQAEVLAQRMVDIAERIEWLRSYWARTLSVEVDREIQTWLANLQSLAKNLPNEIAEAILKNRSYLLAQKVQEVKKWEIPEKLQLALLAPSAPALDPAGTRAELYNAMRQPRPPKPTDPPPNYLPDGFGVL
jgi:hypothetical protein